MAKRLGRIPKQVHSHAGPVQVVIVADLCDEHGKSLFGYWEPDLRVISLTKGMSLVTAWQTLRHEQFHAWISDLGIDLTKTKAEALCEAYASGRMGELAQEK